jgi:hypothetical protein
MERGAAFAVSVEFPATVTSALLVDCKCHDDWLLVYVFFRKMSALCCSVWLILNMPAPSIDNEQFLLWWKLAFLNWGEHM